MKVFIRLLALVAMFTASHASLASAALITWEFDGQVSRVTNDPFGSPNLDQTVHLGDPLSFAVTFDTAVANSCPAPSSGTSGNYFAVLNSTLSFSGFTYTSGRGNIEVHSENGNCFGNTVM